MEYEIGDKVELESGKIVKITYINKILDNPKVYFYGNPYMVISEPIIRKIEDWALGLTNAFLYASLV